jgi:hypothetical protein
VQPASAYFVTVTRLLGCTASAVGQEPDKGFQQQVMSIVKLKTFLCTVNIKDKRHSMVKLPVVFVEPVPVNLVTEELCSTRKVWIL